MWSGADLQSLSEIRHEAQERDKLTKYGWLQHDGRSYGSQELVDKKNGLKLTTSFIKIADEGNSHGGHWAVRLKGVPYSANAKFPANISVINYIGIEEDGHALSCGSKRSKSGMNGDVSIHGSSSDTGSFTVYMPEKAEHNAVPEPTKFSKLPGVRNLQKTHVTGIRVAPEEVWQVKRLLEQQLHEDARTAFGSVVQARQRSAAKRGKELSQRQMYAPSPGVFGTLNDRIQGQSNLMAVQRVLTVPFEIDVMFVSHPGVPHDKDGKTTKTPSSVQDKLDRIHNTLQDQLVRHSDKFNDRFEETFHLTAKGYDEDHVAFARAALSNMVGGIGYWHGSSLMAREDEGGEPTYAAPIPLYSAVPSRSFFPRGFLWDEGFHQLLVGQWDKEISADVLSHWMGAVRPSGYIPREQILGKEAESRVPAEFQVQHADFANPPTLLLPLRAVADRVMDRSAEDDELSAAFSSFGAAGDMSWSHQQDEDLLRAAYPRLKAWYNWFLRTQSGPREFSFRWRGRTENHTLTSGLDDYPRARTPSDQEMHLDLMCWMSFAAKLLENIAASIGEDTSEYASMAESLASKLDEYHWNARTASYCDVGESTTEGEGGDEFVEHVGYVSLFPLLLGVLRADSPHLKDVLDSLTRKDGLRSDFGIRSLALDDSLFGDGENYWKGPIWININYLVVRALKLYYSDAGPHAAQARGVYQDLRDDLIKTIYENYARTGYLWEQYSPTDGRGQRSHPFTGWTALITLIMGEVY